MHTILPPAWPSPYRLLCMAILAAVVVAQLVGLVVLARSQVHKAELRAMVERSARWEAAHCSETESRSESAGCSKGPATASDGLMTARHALFR